MIRQRIINILPIVLKKIKALKSIQDLKDMKMYSCSDFENDHQPKKSYFSEISFNSDDTENIKSNSKQEKKDKENDSSKGNFNFNTSYWIKKIHEIYDFLIDDQDRIVRILADNIKIEMMTNLDYEDNKSDSINSDFEIEKRLHEHEQMIKEIHEKVE